MGDSNSELARYLPRISQINGEEDRIQRLQHGRFHSKCFRLAKWIAENHLYTSFSVVEQSSIMKLHTSSSMGLFAWQSILIELLSGRSETRAIRMSS
jgi:hypothetical protein